MTTSNCAECQKPTVENDRIEFFCDGQIVKTRHSECHFIAQCAEFKKTGRLSTNVMIQAALRTMNAGLHEWGIADDIRQAGERLEEDVKRFNIEAWFGGVSSMLERRETTNEWQLIYPRTPASLQSIIEDSPHRTLSAKLEECGITVTGQEMAGRALVELENAVARITLIAAAGEQTARMGIQGIDGTEEQCRIMINAVRRWWRELIFKPVRG